MIAPTVEGPAACLPPTIGVEPTPADVRLTTWELDADRRVIAYVNPARLDRVHLRLAFVGHDGTEHLAHRGASVSLPTPVALPSLAPCAVALAVAAAVEGSR